jgi:SNF2 family DNA or RNA helicase
LNQIARLQASKHKTLNILRGDMDVSAEPDTTGLLINRRRRQQLTIAHSTIIADGIPEVAVQSSLVKIANPIVVSSKVRPVGVKVNSYYFDSNAPPIARKKSTTATPTQSSNDRRPAKPSPSISRLSPPRDVIKLQDRLFYLLQPPLESIVAAGEISLPFDPFPHQFSGVAFLFPRESAVLADEMGLGKTMQAITTVRLLIRRGELDQVLLICPKPLVTNWVREFKLWAPEIPVSVIEGNQAQRQFHWSQRNTPVKIANYELVTRDQPGESIDDLKFDLVILDEAQRIKNKSSATSHAVRAIKRDRSWALTGTPVENGISDIVGIFEFLSKGLISDGMTPRNVQREVSDHILRRTKDQVMGDMPPRLFRDANIDLTPEQRDRYDRAESDGIIALNNMVDSITIQHVFELVLRLKQICNFDPLTGASAKLERLVADLDEVAASNQKAIVFSQWVNTLEQIGAKIPEFNPLYYHGRIPSSQRDDVLNRFKEDPKHKVILMSYGAGSVGLNLQFCRYVFLFDRWWNPAVEDQAINRAHRIGVVGSVTVTRMLAINSIEERINQVLEEKRELFDIVMGQCDPERQTGLSREEVFGLFDLNTAKPRTRVA